LRKKEKNKINIVRLFITILFMVCLIFFIINSTETLKNRTNTFVVANGFLSYEEITEGYVIRDETILQGENYKNGMIQVVSDNQRVAKNQTVFRYYSNGEEEIQNKISKLDEEIHQVLESSGTNIFSSDIISLENQIEETINLMYSVNNIQKMEENKKKIESYVSKKAKITGSLSPSDSYVKTLIKQRDDLETQLQENSEMVTAPKAGLISYRVDGLEEILKPDNFNYLTTELLNSFKLNVGAVIPINNEKGKIVNNFNCYIAVSINTEKSLTAKVGEVVTLRLSTTEEIPATIVFIQDEEDETRIIVFEINKEIKELIEYRKISFDIIWWNSTGWKISNQGLVQEDDRDYVERNKAGITEKILVKVIRQNDTYSIIKNYTDDELREIFKFTDEEIGKRKQIQLYDEIILH